MKLNEQPGATSVHGYPIIQQFRTAPDSVTRAGRIILVDKGLPTPGHQRYVVAWQGMNRFSHEWDHDWGNGHYFRYLSEAALEYEKQVKRWGGEL